MSVFDKLRRSSPPEGDRLTAIWKPIQPTGLTPVRFRHRLHDEFLPVLTLGGVASFALLLIWWHVDPTAAVTITSAVGTVSIGFARHARLRNALTSVASLAIVASFALVLIHWGYSPTLTITTTFGIGTIAYTIWRWLFGVRRTTAA